MRQKTRIFNYALSFLGATVFAFGFNVFVEPSMLFSASMAGVAQILRELLVEFARLPIPANFNTTGLLLLLLNIPLLVLAWRAISPSFLAKTIATVAVQTVALSLIPVPGRPLLDNVLTESIVGGLVCGVGAGLTLRAGGSGGGADILGVYMAKKFKAFSVGRISLIIGAGVFVYCLVRRDTNILVYSAIFNAVYAFTVDRVHYQNIATSATIFTQNPEVTKYITETMRRGVTCWDGYGAYTGEKTNVYVTVISKYEVATLKREVLRRDPVAFIIFSEGMDVVGNFERRLSAE